MILDGTTYLTTSQCTIVIVFQPRGGVTHLGHTNIGRRTLVFEANEMVTLTATRGVATGGS